MINPAKLHNSGTFGHVLSCFFAASHDFNRFSMIFNQTWNLKHHLRAWQAGQVHLHQHLLYHRLASRAHVHGHEQQLELVAAQAQEA